MLKLKSISLEAITSALEKAERYRLLNEPREAESICRDVLLADSHNQRGLVVLILALSDQFSAGFGVHLDDVRSLLDELNDDYERAYYEGVLLERWGKAQLGRETPAHVINDWLRQAMNCFANAEARRPPSNDDAILRWNACARIIERSSEGGSGSPDSRQGGPAEGFDDEVPAV